MRCAADQQEHRETMDCPLAYPEEVGGRGCNLSLHPRFLTCYSAPVLFSPIGRQSLPAAPKARLSAREEYAALFPGFHGWAGGLFMWARTVAAKAVADGERKAPLRQTKKTVSRPKYWLMMRWWRFG